MTKASTKYLFALLVFIGLGFYTFSEPVKGKNGFDLSNSLIAKQQILSGGPPRDGIPAIDQPKFIPSAQADFLTADDTVIGVVIDQVARAYPTKILIWHEIVNDTVNDQPLVVTYCPLCGTGMVFNRRIKGQTLTFGVSGLLYQSDVLMYDRENLSLWSQLGLKAVTGPLAGQPLQWLASKQMTWQSWLTHYPNSEVLSTDTGFARDYTANAYGRYFDSTETMFPVPQHRQELPAKSWVVGILQDGIAKAYPIAALAKQPSIIDTVGQQTLSIDYEDSAKRVSIRNARGQLIPAVHVFWFAWQAFYPQTQLWQP